MREGGTLQVHLGPYYSDYDDIQNPNSPDRLPFGMNVVMRDHHNDTVDHRVLSENVSLIDPYHPLMSGIDPSSLSGINGGTHVALSALDLNQVKSENIPQVCSDGAPVGPKAER